MQETEGNWDSKIRGVIFDLDNTLVDFITAKRKACEDVVEYLGKGNGNDLFDHFFRGVHDIENTDNIGDYLRSSGIYSTESLKICSRIYLGSKTDYIRAYPGVIDTLALLRERGFILAVLTDATGDNARERLEKAGISMYFDTVVTFDLTGFKKPHHEPYIYCLGEMGLTPREVILVGDSLRRDIAPALELGMTTVHAEYGDKNLFENRDISAHFEIRDIRELKDIPGLNLRTEKD